MPYMDIRILTTPTNLLNDMKKLLLFVILVVFSFQMNAKNPNPIVKCLSAYEIAQCATPEAVAYNFIESILCRDYEVAIAYVQDEWYYEKNGSLYYNLNQTVKDGMIYIPGEPKPYVGINEKKVYVTCSPTSEVNRLGFQDITRYGGTNVKILLTEVNGKS